MLLAGFTGLFSLGHAAFLGVGAYTQAVLHRHGVPFPLALAARRLLSAAVGVVVGLPALRVKGIYLGIATLAFGFIVEEVFARWESVTGGNAGMHVKAPTMFGWTARPATRRSTSSAWPSRCSPRWPSSTCCARRPAAPSSRSATREISAQSMGIHLARYKTLSFAISAALAGIGGALYAHKLQLHLARPVQHPAVDRPAADGGDRRPGLGARRLPRRDLPDRDAAGDRAGQGLPARRASARRPACRRVVYGAVLIAFVLFEPLGLYGRWLKMRTYFQLFPFYRSGMFKRQKSLPRSRTG